MLWSHTDYQRKLLLFGEIEQLQWNAFNICPQQVVIVISKINELPWLFFGVYLVLIT